MLDTDALKMGVAMMGQSNSIGNGLTSDLSAPLAADYPQVLYAWRVAGVLAPLTGARGALRTRTTTHGAEITMGRDLDAAGLSQVRIYKNATSGQAIQYFITNWSTMATDMRADSGGWGVLDTLVWQQGEADCTAALAPSYQSQLSVIAGLWRTYTGNPNSRVIIVGIAENITEASWLAAGGVAWRPTITAAQAAFVAGDVNAKLVPWSASWTLTGDGIHYGSAAQQLIGSAVAAAILEP